MNARPQSVACPINNLPARLYCTKGPATYYIEPTSGTIFQAEIPTVSQMTEYANQEYKAGVYKEYAGARDLKLATARPRLAAIKRLAPGKRLLDVGCATGFFLEAAADQGFEVRGVEFSEIAISLARPDIRERIVCGDVNSLLKSEAQKYDVVTAFDIVEHVQDPGKFLREIREIITPGGFLVLSTPDTGHLLRYLMRSKWPMLQPMQHTVLFSKRGIASLLDHCGYVNVKVETAYKVLALDYLADQLVATNPSLHHLYRGLRWIVPSSLRHRPFAANIGELITYARRPR
jgi:2-polyprenyl-3-methyl-5-hydroxy-6-metoxy-1,4-benzoquinol methylase